MSDFDADLIKNKLPLCIVVVLARYKNKEKCIYDEEIVELTTKHVNILIYNKNI